MEAVKSGFAGEAVEGNVQRRVRHPVIGSGAATVRAMPASVVAVIGEHQSAGR
jgi:hypothetical protein